MKDKFYTLNLIGIFFLSLIVLSFSHKVSSHKYIIIQKSFRAKEYQDFTDLKHKTDQYSQSTSPIEVKNDDDSKIGKVKQQNQLNQQQQRKRQKHHNHSKLKKPKTSIQSLTVDNQKNMVMDAQIHHKPKKQKAKRLLRQPPKEEMSVEDDEGEDDDEGLKDIDVSFYAPIVIMVIIMTVMSIIIGFVLLVLISSSKTMPPPISEKDFKNIINLKKAYFEEKLRLKSQNKKLQRCKERNKENGSERCVSFGCNTSQYSGFSNNITSLDQMTNGNMSTMDEILLYVAEQEKEEQLFASKL